jgi:F1F0 ATPase subunit 2
MNETLTLLLAGVAGLLLGAFFFGGLWWTVRKGASSQRSALWFFGSFVLRTSLVLAGFYLVGRAHWQPLLACLLGFVMARPLVTWLTRSSEHLPIRRATETRHAP